GAGEGVGDALGGDRVLDVASVASELPARPEWRPEEVGDAAGDDAPTTGGGADPLGELGCAVDRGQVAVLDVAAELARLGVGAADEHEGGAVVGWDGGDAAVAADDGEHPVDGEPVPVRVERSLQ